MNFLALIWQPRTARVAVKSSLIAMAAVWPAIAQAAYIELAPGGLLAVGTSYSDPQTLWVGGVRLAFGILALFTVIKAIKGYFGTLTHGGSDDAREMAFTDLKDSATILVLAIAGAAIAPYAVDIAFRLAAGGGISFG